MLFYMALAGIVIRVECNYGRTIRLLDEYVIYPMAGKSADTIVRITRDDIIREMKNAKGLDEEQIRISQQHSLIPDIKIVEFEPVTLQRRIAETMLGFSTMLMHGAVVAKDGCAYMFTAPSGTGKSTRANLWLQEYPESVIINGDKPLIKIEPKEVLACGTPWCGKEGLNTNTMVPLRAIFLLERATEGEEDYIEEVNIRKAFPTLLQQSYRPMDAKSMGLTLHLLKSLDGKVKIYRYRSSPTRKAIRLAYETARPN